MQRRQFLALSGLGLAGMMLPNARLIAAEELLAPADVARKKALADTVLVMAAQPGRIVWRLDVAQPPDQRSDEWVLRQTAALLAQAPVRAAFGLPALASGDAPEVPGVSDAHALAAGQAVAPEMTATRHGC